MEIQPERTAWRTEHLEESDVCRVLESERQRRVLKILRERTAPVHLEELARSVAAREESGHSDVNSDGDVALTLHHVHLPKMEELDLLEYEPAETRVVSCPG